MLAGRHVARIPRLALRSHLIESIRVRRPAHFESHSRQTQISVHPTFSFRSYSTSLPMATELVRKLEALSIKPSTTLSHAETTSPATWKDTLIASGSAPAPFELIKTLVYKPKTAKTATPVPVVVIAREETETNSGAIGKKLNLKELRLASEDLLTDFFSLNKNSRACFAYLCI